MANDDEAVLGIIENTTRSVANVDTIRMFRDVHYRVVPVKGMGSGFVFDEQGHLLTNAHVVDGSERIGATFPDGSVLEGRLVGSCRIHDVAVVKLDGNGFTPLECGDSDALRIGQRVYAIGNPFGLTGGPTVTSGVISALDRSIQSNRGGFENLVQTDAAINPGNSGGPLVDEKGKVVAINTAIIPFAQGIGFAVPINVVKKCAEGIITTGSPTGPWLGVSGITVNRNISRYYNLSVDRGVLILRVWPDSPAEKAKISVGDVILSVGDSNVDSSEGLQKAIQENGTGIVEITLMKGRRKWLVEAKLEKMP